MKVRNAVNVDIEETMRISLTIKLKNDINGMENILTLSSIVEEILEDCCLLIQMPIHQGYHYPLPRDEQILLHFITDTNMYALPVLFLERVERGGFMFAKVRRNGRVVPHQRRDCYRYPCSLPVMVERLWIKERERYPDRQPTAGLMMDFSDNGALIATDENIEKGEKVTLTFVMMGITENAEGMALRSEHIEDGKYLYRVAIQFRNTDKVKKRRFYKHIVDMQSEERRRWTQDLRPLYPSRKEPESSDETEVISTNKLDDTKEQT